MIFSEKWVKMLIVPLIFDTMSSLMGHSENKNVMKLTLSESKVKPAVQDIMKAQQPEPRFRTAKVIQHFYFRNDVL